MEPFTTLPESQTHKVTIGVVFPIEVTIPDNWHENAINFWLNGSSLCLSSFKELIQTILLEDCICEPCFGIPPEKLKTLKEESYDFEFD